MGRYNISFIYVFNAILFLITGIFTFVQHKIHRKRELEPFILCVFFFLSLSYGTHAVVYMTMSSVLFTFGVLADLLVAGLCFCYLALALGKEGIAPFGYVYKQYSKLKQRIGVSRKVKK